jgi:hypothetical protein
VIAFYDAKYAYRLWRPVTAIRAADADGNPTRRRPELDAALGPPRRIRPTRGARHDQRRGADVLRAATATTSPSRVTSPALPGVERSFVSFSEAAEAPA